MKSKTFEFIYRDTAVNFLLNPFNSAVMVNATEMAKIFDKRVDNFLRLEDTKKFISILQNRKKTVFDPSDVRDQKQENAILKTTNKATFMDRKLAIYFAFWLDIDFQIWVIDTIDEILFGNYKKHWDAHVEQEAAKERMQQIKAEILLNPTAELVQEYFQNEEISKNTASEKRKAISEQIHLFNYLQQNK